MAHGYENLILAHQLNDRLEWLLMQLTKGCGLNSLLGFRSIEQVDFRFLDSKENLARDLTLDSPQKYCVIRHMSAISRNEILAFLKKHKITFLSTKAIKVKNLSAIIFANILAKN